MNYAIFFGLIALAGISFYSGIFYIRSKIRWNIEELVETVLRDLESDNIIEIRRMPNGFDEVFSGTKKYVSE